MATKKYEILLVDDDRRFLDSFGTLLEGREHELTKAGCGEKAIELLEQRAFDLVITDLVMGEVDGFEVVKATKNIHPEAVTIVLTGHKTVDFAIKALRLGVDDFLLKPCAAEDIEFRIQRCLEKGELLKQKQKTEQALRESEEKYRTLVEAITDAIFVLDRDKHFAFVNSHGARWLHKRREDVLGKEIGDIFPKRIAKQMIENVDYVFERKVTITEERSALLGSQLRYISTVLVPIPNPQGDVESVMGIARDVTHLKNIEEKLRKSEERFRAITESAQDSIFIKDCSLKYLYVNPAMERLLQTSAAELIGQSDEELFGGEAGYHIRQVDRRVLEGEVVSEEDTKLVRGVPTSFHVIKVPLRDSSNQVAGL